MAGGDECHEANEWDILGHNASEGVELRNIRHCRGRRFRGNGRQYEEQRNGKPLLALPGSEAVA